MLIGTNRCLARRILLIHKKRMRRMLTSVITILGLSFMSPGFAQDAHTEEGGTVFVMTNATEKNEILSYSRDANGSRFETDGRGSGGLTDPLESQGSLILSQDHAFLFAGNADSGSISVFRVDRSQLSLAHVVQSGGGEPNALAQHDDLLYVLNIGGSSDCSRLQAEQEWQAHAYTQLRAFPQHQYQRCGIISV